MWGQGKENVRQGWPPGTIGQPFSEYPGVLWSHDWYKGRFLLIYNPSVGFRALSLSNPSLFRQTIRLRTPGLSVSMVEADGDWKFSNGLRL